MKIRFASALRGSSTLHLCARSLSATGVLVMSAILARATPQCVEETSNTGIGCVPMDLAINVDHDEVVVRILDPYTEASLATRADWLRIGSPSFSLAITARFGGSLEGRPR